MWLPTCQYRGSLASLAHSNGSVGIWSQNYMSYHTHISWQETQKWACTRGPSLWPSMGVQNTWNQCAVIGIGKVTNSRRIMSTFIKIGTKKSVWLHIQSQVSNTCSAFPISFACCISCCQCAAYTWLLFWYGWRIWLKVFVIQRWLWTERGTWDSDNALCCLVKGACPLRAAVSFTG